MIEYASMSSPVGMLWIAATDRGIVRLDMSADEVQFVHSLPDYPGGDADEQVRLVQKARSQLGEYFAGERRTFDVLLDLRGTSPFQRTVLTELQHVPWGETISYGGLAAVAGRPGAARAAGTAVATNPVSLLVPCHRVIRSDGTPGEYARRSLGSRGRNLKHVLLKLEGSLPREYHAST